jgi:hypothetical protein
MDVPPRTDELDETPAVISSDLDFSSPLVGQEVVFDPYSDPADDSAPRIILPTSTTLAAPEPPALLIFPLGLASFAIFATISRLSRLLRSLKRSGRPGRRKVRREIRMMA